MTTPPEAPRGEKAAGRGHRKFSDFLPTAGSVSVGRTLL